MIQIAHLILQDNQCETVACVFACVDFQCLVDLDVLLSYYVYRELSLSEWMQLISLTDTSLWPLMSERAIIF